MEAIGRFFKFIFLWVFYPFTKEYMNLQREMASLDVFLTGLEIPFEKKEEWGLRGRVEFLLLNATNKVMLPPVYKVKELSHLAAQDLLRDQLEAGTRAFEELREKYRELQQEVTILREQVDQKSENEALKTNQSDDKESHHE